jgi:hypothetical protein
LALQFIWIGQYHPCESKLSSENSLPNKPSSLLDIPFSRLGRWLLPVILMILPAGLAGLQFKPDTLFTNLKATKRHNKASYP